LSFLVSLNEGCKQLTKHTRYSYLKAFFNFIRNNLDSQLPNPCDTPMLKKLFRVEKLGRWQIHEKETIDEIIFRTTKVRNRLMLELIVRGGMGVGEVLQFHAADVDDQNLTIRNPKSGRSSEAVFIPKKLADGLKRLHQGKGDRKGTKDFPHLLYCSQGHSQKGGHFSRSSFTATRSAAPRGHVCLPFRCSCGDRQQGYPEAWQSFHHSKISGKGQRCRSGPMD
jgi:integrase